MERNGSPVSNSPSASSPPSSPLPSDSLEVEVPVVRKKKTRKKRKAPGGDDNNNNVDEAQHHAVRKQKKAKHNRRKQEKLASQQQVQPSHQEPKPNPEESRSRKARKLARSRALPTQQQQEAPSPSQVATNEQMRRALEEDQYSANGSIVDTDSDEDDHNYTFHGTKVRLDRNALLGAVRKYLWMDRMASSSTSTSTVASSAIHQADNDEDDRDNTRPGKKKKKKGKRGKEDDRGLVIAPEIDREVDRVDPNAVHQDPMGIMDAAVDDYARDEGSIFGQTTGSSNFTWVECDKCKKWRRLRGVVDEKKLPLKWYCSMNKSDPERARCSAPEEEYETPHTPESAADARTRKHLRVWVRRLQCNEAYEARQPTLTRGKKRAAASSSKEPYEWVRCCNPSCGKWRAILKIMDAKTNVIDHAARQEWFCVMNTWDEKTASCAAPQENLPAVGCPPWVNVDDN